MPTFVDKTGVRHHCERYIDIIEAPGGLEVAIVLAQMPNGQMFAINIVSTFDKVVAAFVEERMRAQGWNLPVLPDEVVQ